MKMKTKNRQKKSGGINYDELVEKYNLLVYLMDHIPDVIYFKDRKGKLILVNRAHAKGFGLEPKDIKGKTDFDLFSRKKAAKMTKDDMYVLRTGKPIIDKIERATRPNGGDNYVSTTKIPKFNSKGKVEGLIGITRDVTRRIQLERLKDKHGRIEKRLEILEELSGMKSNFVSTVSHELRTPLSIIKQLITLLFNETAGPINKRQREIVKRSQDNVERLKKIIDELLDISRIESGRFQLHYSLVNLRDLLTHSQDFFKKSAQEKNIDLSYRLPEKAVNLFIDADRVNQAISNLIDNAIKFTEQGGEIKVELKVLEAKVRIGVVDTGIGIAKSNLPLLFKRFEQVSKIASAEGKGVGLGLSLTKEWVERHGGEIWIESKLGVGSKFYFTLPRYYVPHVLDNRIMDGINNLLKRKIPLCIVNLQIVNYREAKKSIRVGSRRFFRDLEAIINETLKRIGKPTRERPKIALTDINEGRCSVIFPKATEKKATKLASSLKDRIKGYFSKNRIKDVFVTLGILSFPHEDQTHLVKHLPARIYIKKIFIGLEKRQFKRIYYRININLFLPENKTEEVEAVNISEGGVSFISSRLLETDSLVDVRITFPRNKKTIHTRARVAWVKKLGKGLEEAVDRYQLGVEFIKLQDKDKNILLKELK